jgi:hypothetical protein
MTAPPSLTERSLGMASNSSERSRFSPGTAGRAPLVTLAVAVAVAVASVAAADPIDVALVESIDGSPPGVGFMDYVRVGQIIRLNPYETIVLNYMASCVHETITGGIVTVGTDRSEVLSGVVSRIGGQCNAGKIETTGEQRQVGGRTFRGRPK